MKLKTGAQCMGFDRESLRVCTHGSTGLSKVAGSWQKITTKFVFLSGYFTVIY